MKRITAVFTLENVLLCNKHRAHLIPAYPSGPKDWQDYWEAAKDDVPRMELIAVVNALIRDGWDILLISSRPDYLLHSTISKLSSLLVTPAPYEGQQILYKLRTHSDKVFLEVLNGFLTQHKNEGMDIRFGITRNSRLMRILRNHFPGAHFSYSEVFRTQKDKG